MFKIGSILLLGITIRLFGMAIMSLGEWDERFHALVAKNLMSTPLIPTLINDGLMPLNPNDWSMNEIWLSKPPLAFWFMSWSMKIFGVNEWGLRLPSLIFSTLSVYLTYWIGNKLFDERVGLIAAFLYSISGIMYQINIGNLAGDHVDTLFHLLFQLAIVVLLSYNKKPSLTSGAMIGVLTGFAFLTKWTMAFFIPTVCLCYFTYTTRNVKDTLIYLISLVVSMVLVISPWMMWIVSKFPTETMDMMNGIIRPMNQVVQLHSGLWYYYLNTMRININELIYIPLVFIIVKSFRRLTDARFLLVVWIF
ncbi:MAG TPA: glycosyltransferase family 39 protein, partial [Saprospiraceae bacterium]|nr:glycosyltransferase family 39 protein [Saprospiraceae bacterium]